MARSSRHTLLSLDRFAKIFGINPVHFQGASGGTFWPRAGSCDETWAQYPWQSGDTVSRDELGQIIGSCEDEIARYLHFDLAPRWHLAETHRWPSHYDTTTRNLHASANFSQPGVQLSLGKIIAGGRRATTLIDGRASVVYSDADLDGWSELATITVATTLTDTSEIKLFFAGQDGHPAWEIRPLLSITADGVNAVITANSWLFIQPGLQEAYPRSATMDDISIDDTTNYVDVVDVYRIYNDTTAVSSQLRWPSSCSLCGGVGCVACSPTTQDGCIAIVDPERGIVRPIPSTYSESSGWTQDAWASYQAPASIQFWYYSGYVDEYYLAGFNREPLSDYLAEAIAWMAAARIPRPICQCSTVVRAVNEMQVDLLVNKRDAARFVPANSYVQTNPFGTRYGEVKAWQRVSEIMIEHGGAF